MDISPYPIFLNTSSINVQLWMLRKERVNRSIK